MTDCLKLKEVVLGKNLKSLSGSAFFRSEYITTVEIKSDLKVEYNPFYACPDLISFVGNNTTEDSRCWIVDGVLMAFARKGITEYTVPGYVKEIGNYAFNTCPLLASVHLGSDVSTIKSWTFYSANSSLTEIYCRATTPPSIYYNANSGYGSFPYSAEIKFYVPREAVDNYLQYTACKDGRYKDNWYLYRDNIIPYDFE